MENNLELELTIANLGKRYKAILEGEVTLTSNSKGAPSELAFNVVKDGIINFTEGNHVRFKVNGKEVFYGIVFEKSRDKSGIISVRAFDQLRYLQNKDNLEFTPRTADKYITRIAGQLRLTCGELANTEYEIPHTLEEGSSYYDMIMKALDATKKMKGKEYMLYDDYKKITLKNVEDMKTDCYICSKNLENFNYTTSIDNETYNKVKLFKEDGATKKGGTMFSEKDEENISKWGVLLYYEKMATDDENGRTKALKLLKEYNKKNVKLSLSKVLGDIIVRGGSSVFVELDLGDIYLKQYMLVTRCVHKFSEGKHLMDLDVKGGIVNG